MTFYAQSLLAADADFRARVAACVARERIGRTLPSVWADQNIEWVAAAPGFADAYWYACETGVEHPGRDEAVISDEQILAAVQQRMQEAT